MSAAADSLVTDIEGVDEITSTELTRIDMRGYLTVIRISYRHGRGDRAAMALTVSAAKELRILLDRVVPKAERRPEATWGRRRGMRE